MTRGAASAGERATAGIAWLALIRLLAAGCSTRQISALGDLRVRTRRARAGPPANGVTITPWLAYVRYQVRRGERSDWPPPPLSAAGPPAGIGAKVCTAP